VPRVFINGDAGFATFAKNVVLADDVSRYDFVTLESAPDETLLVRKVPAKDLNGFEGLLFQVNEDEDDADIVFLNQVQMFFWPWDDDEEFDDADSPDDEG
jgi:hypothetical protein